MKVEDQPRGWILCKCQQACKRLHCVKENTIISSLEMFAICLLLFLLCCGSRDTTVFCLARCSIDRKKKIKLFAKYGVF
jgi:hypothetical protein